MTQDFLKIPNFLLFSMRQSLVPFESHALQKDNFAKIEFNR